MNVLCVRISRDAMGSFLSLLNIIFAPISRPTTTAPIAFHFALSGLWYFGGLSIYLLSNFGLTPSQPFPPPPFSRPGIMKTTPLLPNEIINKTKRVQITVKSCPIPLMLPKLSPNISIFIQKSFRLGDMQAHPYNTMFNLQALIDIQPGFWFIFHVPTYARKIYFRSSKTFFYLSTPIWIGSRKCSVNFPKM